MKKPSEVLRSLQAELPPAPPPAGLYKPVVVAANMLYVSGQGPMRPDGSNIKGRLGNDFSLEEGKAAARQVGLTMLATITEHFGSLDRINRIIKVLGMVNSSPDFGDQPLVINGFSELMSEVFGSDKGVGARSAVGMILPGNIAVEIEAIFELHPD